MYDQHYQDKKSRQCQKEIMKKLNIPVSSGSEGQITPKENWVSKQKWPESSTDGSNSPPPAQDDDDEAEADDGAVSRHRLVAEATRVVVDEAEGTELLREAADHGGRQLSTFGDDRNHG